MARDIDADFTHHLDCFRSYLRRLNTRACDFKTIARHLSQDPLGHLASRGVSRAEKQDSLLIAHITLLSCGTNTDSASFGSDGTSQRNNAVAAPAPASCARINTGVSLGRMPENVSVTERASVTAGFANDVDAVNQYAAVI